MADQMTKKLTKYIREGVAMEQSVLRMLDSMLRTTEDPELQKALEAHKRTTRRHMERLRDRLEAHGASPSLVRQAGGTVGAGVKAVVDVARRDKPGRNARDGFATEQLEIASYELLERVARRAGDEETAEVARQNRAEDEAMAALIARNWDKFAEQSVSGNGGGGGGKAEALKARAKGLGSIAQNPIVLAVGSVAAGALVGRRVQSGAGAQQRSTQQSDRPLEQLSKAELQTRAAEAGIEVTRSMKKQELIDALRGRKTGAAARGRRANPIEVQKFLEGVGYPVAKSDLVREAERQGADPRVRETLSRLPRKQFRTPADVSKAIGDLG